MNELNDKPLNDRMRRLLDDYEPNIDIDELTVDWRLLRPRLFPHRQRPLVWFWTLVLIGLLGGLGWYGLIGKRPEISPVVLKKPVSVPERTLIPDHSLPVATVSVPQKVPVSKAVVIRRQTVRRVVDTDVSVQPEQPNLPEKIAVKETYVAADVGQITGVRMVKTAAHEWPTVAHRTLSPPEQALEDKLLSGVIEADSTVFAALSRNLRQWPNSVIVCDLTTSMDPYAAQIYAWFRRNAKNPQVRGVVFFTDCDSLGQETRLNGPPGAFFTTRERDPRAALPTLLAAARNTQNNRNSDENVVEALRYAQRTFPESRHLILLADNGSGVKDMPLLPGLTKPVHVIACGPPLNNAHAFQDDQYQIARQTGGSVHTLDDDVEPSQVSRGTFVRVGKYYYRYSPRKNRFVKTHFERRPIRVLGVRL
ncbi:hypothetical protein J2I47_20675 [Fibrella sp. HMF5335]|uniref:Uncharacterized protein n=1 Tax=Fibrella rubiginis TaxID=2817060 RepID=A0A939K7T3_9BACT|nr:hypothetical protein [Fibrella rubiginis]MBO0938980.1 hypothetical protein [Fibrella rubiginis]